MTEESPAIAELRERVTRLAALAAPEREPFAEAAKAPTREVKKAYR